MIVNQGSNVLLGRVEFKRIEIYNFLRNDFNFAANDKRFQIQPKNDTRISRVKSQMFEDSPEIP